MLTGSSGRRPVRWIAPRLCGRIPTNSVQDACGGLKRDAISGGGRRKCLTNPVHLDVKRLGPSKLLVYLVDVRVDVKAVLSTFMVNGLPDATRFRKVFGDLLSSVVKAQKGKPPGVAACGEFAPTLWAQGQDETIHISTPVELIRLRSPLKRRVSQVGARSLRGAAFS